LVQRHKKVHRKTGGKTTIAALLIITFIQILTIAAMPKLVKETTAPQLTPREQNILKAYEQSVATLEHLLSISVYPAMQRHYKLQIEINKAKIEKMKGKKPAEI